jgi:hypothetical protein
MPLCRWSWELGIVTALELLVACSGLCLLILYLRLNADAEKFVWNQLGRFCFFVAFTALFGAAGGFARLQNQIM